MSRYTNFFLTIITNIFQITTLVQLQMLVSIGGEVSIDSAHFQCAVGLNYIETVAQSVGFNIRKYLYDFI